MDQGALATLLALRALLIGQKQRRTVDLKPTAG